MIPSPAAETELIAWILQEAIRHNDGYAILANWSQRLHAAGMPIWRVSIAVPTIDPVVRGISMAWRAEEAFEVREIAHSDPVERWLQSPIHKLITEERTFGRWRLEGDPVPDWPHPVLHELRAEGGTDYLLFVVAFPTDTALTGMGLSFTTKVPGGFSDEEVSCLERLVPAIAITTARLSLWYAASEALGTYLGPMTARRVLAGRIQRGQGERIQAAILLADLSGFTKLADGHDPDAVIGWLNEHLDAVGGAVGAAGGEILKFLGDGFLAVFPADDAAATDCAACRSALEAAQAAVTANRSLNVARLAADAPALRADVVLHFGEVMYGNIGTQRRLDFTTIGRAINEASRIEKLCDLLGRDVLLSDSFANRCGGRALVPLGEHALRGVAESRRLWGLPEPDPAAPPGSGTTLESSPS